MICKKCGTEFPDGMKYCPNCGRSFGKAKLKKAAGASALLIACVVLFAGVFLLGIGMGVRGNARIPEKLDFMQVIADKLKTVTALPVNVTLSEDSTNEFIRRNSSAFYPVSDLRMVFGESDGKIILSGSMSKDGIQTLTGGTLPPLLMVFLPQSSALRLDAVLSVGENGRIEVSVEAFRVSDVQIDPEMLSSLGIEEVLTDLINDTISTESSGTLKAENITTEIDGEGNRVLRFKGKFTFDAQPSEG